MNMYQTSHLDDTVIYSSNYFSIFFTKDFILSHILLFSIIK